MYSLVVFLSMLAAYAFAQAFVRRQRRYVPVFGALLAALLYTHNWALFFTVAAAITLALLARKRPNARPLLRDGALALGVALLLYLPWLPTLVFQALHTGAPWSDRPGIVQNTRQLSVVLGGYGAAVALLLAGGEGLRAMLASRHRRLAIALLCLPFATLLVAWLTSQASPAWANRYLAVVTGPLLLVAALGLSRAGRLGLVALAIVALFWFKPHGVGDTQTTERDVAEAITPFLERGDLVISTHPERLPVLDYYLPDNVRLATTLGKVTDPTVMDWRDALKRLQDAKPHRTMEPLLATVPVGARVAIVRPIVSSDKGWRAPWTRLVRRRSAQWNRALARDERFGRTIVEPRDIRNAGVGVRAVVYTKIAN